MHHPECCYQYAAASSPRRLFAEIDDTYIASTGSGRELHSASSVDHLRQAEHGAGDIDDAGNVLACEPSSWCSPTCRSQFDGHAFDGHVNAMSN